MVASQTAAHSPAISSKIDEMWMEAAAWSTPALCVLALAVAFVASRWLCPFGCMTRQPRAYDEDYDDGETDDLLPQLSPIVYYYSGRAHDFDGILDALARARSEVDVNALLPGSALEWMFTSAAKANQFVALCNGHIDFSAVTVNNVASLIAGLHQFASSEPVAQFISECFRGKTATDLLRLKNEIEKRVSLYDVIYRQIESPLYRESILIHMELQAEALRVMSGFCPPLKLLSEVDETLFAVDHDARYPTLTVYPGVHQFTKEVLSSRGAHVLRVSLDTRDHRPVFFTDRLEAWRQRAEPELLSSGFSQYTLIGRAIVDLIRSKNVLLHHKLQAVSRYRRLFSECNFIYVGHNAMDDDDSLGIELLRDPRAYGVVAVMVHDVRGSHQHASTNALTFVRHFRTFVGATLHLYQLQLLPVEAVVRVARAASAAFRAVPFDRSEQQEAAAREFADEVMGLLAALTSKEANALMSVLPSQVARLLVAQESLDDNHRIL